MDKTNKIGLNTEKTKEVADLLNELLANYSFLYQNVRGLHWNIKGDNFFELHLKFEELYDDLFVKIDDIAERILTLGFQPNHNYSAYQKLSEIKELTEVSDGVKGLKEIVHSFTILIKKQRNILTLTGDINDEGTNSLMSDYIREQEKLVWMYSAYLN